MPGYSFPKSRRIRSRKEFSAVFEKRLRASRGPLVLFGLRNELGFSRLAVSTPRKVGMAVKRNRIRRLLRESFRLLQNELPVGYDWVVVVRPHEPQKLADYQRLLTDLCLKMTRT